MALSPSVFVFLLRNSLVYLLLELAQFSDKVFLSAKHCGQLFFIADDVYRPRYLFHLICTHFYAFLQLLLCGNYLLYFARVLLAILRNVESNVLYLALDCLHWYGKRIASRRYAQCQHGRALALEVAKPLPHQLQHVRGTPDRLSPSHVHQ